MNFEEVKRDYDRDGFVLIPGYLSPTELTELRDRAIRLTDELFTKKESKGILEGLEKCDSWFENQLLRGKHVELLKTLLEDDLQPASAAWFDRPSGSTTGIDPHLDAIGRAHAPKAGCTIWLALDAADPDNGCLYYSRGSHKTEQPHKFPILGFDTASEDAVAAEVQPGDAVIHSGLTVHWSGANHSDRSRRAISYFYWGASSLAVEGQKK